MINSKEDRKKVKDAIKNLHQLKGIVYFNYAETVQKIDALTDYICNKNYILETVLKGINRLENENLSSITSNSIEESVKTCFFKKKNWLYPSCHYCEDIGLISMTAGDGYDVSLACICDAGNYRSDLKKWNGKLTQESRGRLLTLANPGHLQPIVY